MGQAVMLGESGDESSFCRCEADHHGFQPMRCSQPVDPLANGKAGQWPSETIVIYGGDWLATTNSNPPSAF